MQRAYCGLLALGLFLGVTEAAKGQPSYVYTTIAVPCSTDTQANGINTSGQIVGFYADLGEHGFLLSGGNYTTLDPRANHAYGINDSGQIVGSASFTLQGFLLSG